MNPVLSPNSPAHLCGVTGAAGYVGSVIAQHLASQGLTLLPLTRNPGSLPNARPFHLGQPIAPDTLAGLHSLVHCAYDFAAFGWDDIHRANVAGTAALFQSARAAGVQRILFISSISAFEGSRSLYGQAKLQAEHIASDVGAIIIRPGLVYGASSRGMVGSLAKIASLPLLAPMVGLGHHLQYLTHEQDLAHLIHYLLTSPTAPPKSPITAACPHPHSLRDIVAALAKAKGRKQLYLPIPPILIHALLRTAESAGLRPRLRSDSLVSLLNQNPSPDFSALSKLGLPFRDLELPAR
jgi:nucleoside-diphosphate-sugar epimerase